MNSEQADPLSAGFLALIGYVHPRFPKDDCGLTARIVSDAEHREIMSDIGAIKAEVRSGPMTEAILSDIYALCCRLRIQTADQPIARV